MAKNVYLVCNAHIDPVWQWEWEEGAAAAVSTFRTAADLCDEFENFIFCHNEVVLYKWIEEYEPSLFERIQKLVKAGKWKIIGGWYLQPDCNMPAGESFVRQILLGREYFSEKFDVRPTTALNFDPFGHTQGLVQILTKSGYNSYVCCRPSPEEMGFKDADFDWIGFDGSKVRVRKANAYGSPLGNSMKKIQDDLEMYEDQDNICILWGVGNHGGGPSRKDIAAINEFIKANGVYDVKHSYFEEFFGDTISTNTNVRQLDSDMNQFSVGCYTSIIRIKQKHRKLEAELYSTEKMVTAAWTRGLIKEYPKEDLRKATEDLCFIEFHDSIPGSSIEPVEDMCVRVADHALEILSRLKAKAFFALCAGEPKAGENEIPIVVYNPHPFKIKTQIPCEFMLADQNYTDDEFTAGIVYQNGKPVPTQNEKEDSNINLDWRKKIVFEAELEPYQINRFDCKLEIKAQPKHTLPLTDGKYIFDNGKLSVTINSRTGLIDDYSIDGVSYLKSNSFELLVMKDNEDPWGMTVSGFRDLYGRFNLMSDERGSKFSGIRENIVPSVRMVENGDVRTVIEACLEHGDSMAVITYKLPKAGTLIEVDVRVYFNEKNKCLKLSIPVKAKDNKYIGQTAYGKYELKDNGEEVVAQKWTAAVSEKENKAFTIINDSTYGSDFSNEDGIRMTLLRSSAFCAHPIGEREVLPQDRFFPRIDQGERNYKFWINAGGIEERMNGIDREADAVSEKPFVLSFFPSGAGEKPGMFMELSDNTIQMPAVKKAEQSDEVVVRLFNPTSDNRNSSLSIPSIGFKQDLAFTKFEIKTLKIDLKTGQSTSVNLIEENI